ncbi:MAG: GNAT family N-acetyltransferase [Gemmatimonadales bacterium]|nr:GNAT family N-acetyltransferase [Gemmatimonadales bacterium]
MSVPLPSPSGVRVRPATAADAALVTRLIHALAEYERLAHACRATEAAVRESLFGAVPQAEVLIAELDTADGVAAAGFALYFHGYSTFEARRGLYLEDLFVEPAWRGRGIGRRLLAELARLAVARGCARFEWSVLRWNELALGLYDRVGATRMEEWVTCRLEGERLAALAAEAPIPPSSA